MNDSTLRFMDLLPKWISTTHDSDIAYPFAEADVSGDAEVLSQLLIDGKICADQFQPSARNLTILSFLCAKISRSGPSDLILLEAERTFGLVLALIPPRDEFGEVPELLCQLSYVAWRASRALGIPTRAAHWQANFEKSLSRESVFRLQCSSLLGSFEGRVCDPTPSRISTCVSDPLILFGVCALLRERRDRSPREALAFARGLYERLKNGDPNYWAVELLYFLGETALCVSTSARLSGEFEKAAEWIEIAEKAFHELTRPDELIAAVLYARLTIAFELTNYSCVLTEVDNLIEWYKGAGLRRGVAKSLYLKGDVLKLIGRLQEAEEVWRAGLKIVEEEHDLRASILAHLSEIKTIRGEFGEALDLLLQAKAITAHGQMSMVSANIEVLFGELNRQCQKWDDALEFFYRGVTQFASLGMKAMVARVRVQIAEALLASGRVVEAERELAAVLPDLTRRRIIPEGLAALALLREAVRQRSMDRREKS